MRIVSEKGECMKKEFLSDWNIVGKETKTDLVFSKMLSRFSSNTDIPSEYVKKKWIKYKKLPSRYQTNSMNGNIFEAIIYTIFIKEKITPIYFQAELEFVPNIKYDLIVFPRKETGNVDVSSPIGFSLKTSLRERYKQADLEGLALKEVYKRAETYLITLDSDQEIEKFEKKVEDKDIRGIDRCINACSSEFDDIINRLKNSGVDEPPDIKAIKSASEIKE